MKTQNKLEIHHVAKRLPYGLKGTFSTLNSKIIFNLTGITDEREEESKIIKVHAYLRAGQPLTSNLIFFQPILFPFSSLSETIIIKGEYFVPIIEIEDSLDVPQGASCLLKETISSLSDFYFTKDLTDILRYSDITNINELLLKWHIDLPHENLIEKGLAISVFDLTENPYA